MSCSTDPANKFRQQVDRSLVRESIQQNPGSSSSRQDAEFNREFASFRSAQLNPQAMSDIYAEMATAHENAKAHFPAAAPAVQGARSATGQAHMQPWAQQFSQMNLGEQPSRAQLPQHIPQQFQSPAQWQSQAQSQWQSHALGPGARVHPSQALSTGAPVPAEDSEIFDKAFAAAESRMSALSSQLNEPRVDNMQEVARGVLATVENTTTTDAVAEKMRNSGFIELMKKMSNNQVIVKDNALVENHEGATYEEWKGPKIEDVEIKQPLFDQAQHEREKASTSSKKGASPPHPQSPLQDPRGGQQPKEDVMEYLNRIGTPDSDRPEMPSALRAAQELGPIPVSIANWEEDYSAWVE